MMHLRITKNGSSNIYIHTKRSGFQIVSVQHGVVYMSHDTRGKILNIKCKVILCHTVYVVNSPVSSVTQFGFCIVQQVIT